MVVRYASNASELSTQFAAASANDIIILSNGAYGTFNFNRSFASDVKIVAANALQATFTSVSFSGADHIVFDGFRVNNGENTNQIFLDGDTNYITIQNCDIGNDSGWGGTGQLKYGIRSEVGTTTYLTIHNNYIHNVENGVSLAENISNLTLTENTFDWIRVDSMKVAGITTALIENNINLGHVYNDPENLLHQDLFQSENIPSNYITFRGNVYIPAVGYSENVEGFFSSDGGVYNSLIEQNILVSGSPNGIYVADNNIIRNNTLLYDVNGTNSWYECLINNYGTGCTIENNVTSHPSAGPYLTSNIHLQYTNPAAPYYGYDQFANYVGWGTTYEGLIPVDGAEIGTKGAYTRILELAGASALPSINSLTLSLVNGLLL